MGPTGEGVRAIHLLWQGEHNLEEVVSGLDRNSRVVVEAIHTIFAAVADVSGVAKQQLPWNCERCTYENTPISLACEMCQHVRDSLDGERFGEQQKQISQDVAVFDVDSPHQSTTRGGGDRASGESARMGTAIEEWIPGVDFHPELKSTGEKVEL